MQIRGLERSYQTELDDFFDTTSTDGVASKTPTDAAFCLARQKVKHSAFIDLGNDLVNSFYRHSIIKTWNNYRLIASDGSTAHVPDTEENLKHFGSWDSKNGDRPCPKARLSFAYDPLNKIIVDAIIGPKSIGEDPMAIQHLDMLQEGDLCIYDRGYLSFFLMKMHEQEKIKYCIRVPVEKCTTLCEDLKVGEDDIEVYYQPSHAAKKACFEVDLPPNSLKVRLVKIKLKTGEYEVLATNILDEEFGTEDFKELYNLRWGVEEEYKRIKSRTELEAYSGKLCDFVYQDFYADIVRLNLSSILACQCREELQAEGEKIKYTHAPNMSYVLTKTKQVVMTLLHKSLQTLSHLLDVFFKRIKRNSEPIRPGRNFPRVRKPFRSGRFLEYKHARC